MNRLVWTVSAALLLGFSLIGCYAQRKSEGGGQIKAVDLPRNVNAKDVAVPAGYRIQAIAVGLNYPTSVTFDNQGNVYVIEAGYSYGEVFSTPRLVRVEPNGAMRVVAEGQKEYAPWTGVVFHEGAFYVAEGGVLNGGRISRISLDGTITPLVSNLPSMGDHHVNGPAIHDGFIYFAVGTATNSGVVGEDNHAFGWLARHPQFCDIPARDIHLTGRNFTTDNPLTPDDKDKAATGAYLPFGVPSQPGQVIPGKLPCTGGIMRIPVKGGPVELVAWGLRNPFGLAFAPDGTLYATENSFDVRGSRPVWGTGDLLWKIQPGLWYGWPDYFSGEPLNEGDRFKAPGHDAPQRLITQLPNDPPQAVTKFGVHSSSNGIDFSRSAGFGFVGDAFVAQFGDMAPGVGKVMYPVGYKVVRVNVESGLIEDFATNPGRHNGPASKLDTGGLERPTAVRFDPSGTALYVVDFGVMTMHGEKAEPRGGTGVLWRITREPT